MDDRNSTTSDGAPARPGAEQASEEGGGPGPADSRSAPLSNFGPPSALPFGQAPSFHPPAPPPFGETVPFHPPPPPPYGDGPASQPVPSYWQELPPDAGTWAAPGGGYFGATASLGAQHSRRRRALAGLAALFAAVCVAVSLVVALGGTDAQAAVINAVNSTMADKTAQATFTGTVESDGQTVIVNGTGDFDFTRSAVGLEVSANAEGQQVKTEELFIGGTLYVQTPGLAQAEPGKTWISVDLSALTNSTAAGSTGAIGSGGNPAANLQLLAQEGNTVTPLGSSTVDGVTVQGYAVTVNPAVINSQLAQDNLPSWMRQTLSNVNFGTTSFKVFIVSVGETIDFSDYGAPVDIQAPPPDQVLDFSQFAQKLAGAPAGS
jgi:hypothetical protein